MTALSVGVVMTCYNNVTSACMAGTLTTLYC